MNRVSSERPLKFLSAVGNDADHLHLARKNFDFLKDAPPPHLMQYREQADAHLRSGQMTASKLRNALSAGGYEFQSGHRFMDFGCSNGRVLRWLKDWADQGEGWGVDINANTVLWCLQHMSPPFNFCVTSTAPHLPFEDRYFNLIYCHSIFTHIDDMFFTWLQELRRVTVIHGHVFITLHDDITANFMLENPKSPQVVQQADHPDFLQFTQEKEDFLAIGRDNRSMVYVRSDFFASIVHAWFTITARVENAMGGYQTGYLLCRQR